MIFKFTISCDGLQSVISDFRRKVDEICARLGKYVAYSGDSLPTFGDNLSVPSSRAKNPKLCTYFLSCGQPDDDHMWLKHAADLK